MDDAESPNAADATRLVQPQLPSIKVEDLRSWSPSRYYYESAGARSTRMIIESSSYHTTPCNSPRPESFLNPHDGKPIDADYISQEISPEIVARSCGSCLTQSIQAGSRNQNRRVRVGETRPGSSQAAKELVRRNSPDETPEEKRHSSSHEMVVQAKISG